MVPAVPILVAWIAVRIFEALTVVPCSCKWRAYEPQWQRWTRLYPYECHKRIEVVKGAASTLYGAEALGGVINVITKTPSTEGGSATVAVGNRGSKRFDVSYGTDKFIVGIDRKYWGTQDPSTPIRYDYAGTKHYDYYSTRNKGNSLGLFMSGKLSDKVTLNFNRVMKVNRPLV